MKEEMTLPATMMIEGTIDDVTGAYVCIVFNNKEEMKRRMMERFKDGEKVSVLVSKTE